MTFINLHTHSEFSLLDGLGKPEQYVRRAKELGQPAIAITDHGNVDGTIKWQKACKKEGIKSIIGCEMYIVPDMKIRQKEKKGHITILVKNQEGWKTLLKMLTVANLDGFYGRPRIDYDLLYENLNEGLIVLTGCSSSFLTLPGGQDLFLDLVDLKMENVYLEVMPHCIPGQEEINSLCLKLSQETGIPLVATNDCHYVLPDQWKAQEVLLAIQRKAKWNDPNRWKFGFTGLHLRTEEEMMKEFEKQGVLSKRQYMLAIMNTNRIAEQCWGFQIPQKLPELPLTKYEKNSPTETTIEILDHFCRSSFFEGQGKVSWNDTYEERYLLEYEIIKKKDFARYFLIIYELVEWAKNNGIAIGPGRGSVGGSLIALLLGITQVDPLKYGLIFERFISEDRIDLPDIDLDFDKDKADLIKKHLEEEYGEYNIAGIGTFLSMQAKAVIRDIGRVFDLPLKEVDTFAKSIKYDQKENVVEHSIETKEGKDFAERYPEQFQLACDLEGQCRGSGQHPAGLIISGQDLRETDRCNLTMREGSKVINWDMGDSEVAGLIKIDVLRLGTLTVLDEIRKTIGKDFRFEGLSFDDQKVFDFISKDSLAGIFQLTGYDCAKLCREYKIESLEDIAAIISLARPGPKGSGMTEQYVQRKKGQKWERLHPLYEEITKETYGVMVYQEQMMRAVMDLAGFSGSDADRIRKVIGKKRDPKEFKPFRESFLRGCLERNTLTEDQANEFWQGLLGWAGYGFNKCLTGDTLLTRSSFNQYTGKHIAIRDLYLEWNKNTPAGSKYRRQGLSIMQMSDDLRCRPGTVIGVFYQGKKPVFQVITETGKKIKGTLNHRLFTFNGYKNIEELKIGDRLAIMGQCQISITERKGQKWRKTNTKGRCGFQEGKDNPAYVDGRTNNFNQAIKKVKIRANGYCEKCHKEQIKEEKFEFAHIRNLEELNNDYSLYHSKENILYLCNSCHKIFDYAKGERVKKFTNGYSIFFDPIVSIENVGNEEVFDIEMEGPEHNFVANDIVSHNSHAIEYSMIGYWTAWAKCCYFDEFLCASLTYGDDEDKEHLIEEAQGKGIQVVTPKVNFSDIRKWVIQDQRLYMPFTEIKGIGEKEAEKCLNIKPARQGFFTLSKTPGSESNNATQKLLTEIKAFDPDPEARPDDCSSYFQFNIGKNHKPLSPIIITKQQATIDRNALECRACGLRQQARQVVLSSSGIYNAAIIAEAPGKRENAKGIGLIGDSGDLLWPELERHGITRRMVHVGNACKCFPSKTRTPSYQEADTCFNKWLVPEIQSMDCKLILGLGGMVYYSLTGKTSGITKASGNLEWVEKIQSWVVWCVHPSFVLRKRSPENIQLFEAGVKAFAEQFEGGKR